MVGVRAMTEDPDRQVFLVPCSNDQATAHLEKAVIDGLEPKDYHGIAGDEPVHLWGTKRKYADRYEFDTGDILLFYTGNREYTVAALIYETTIDEELAPQIWDAPDDEEPWPHLIYLSAPLSISIDSAEIADYAEHSIDYVIQFTRLKDAARQRIVEEHGSILGFINDNREEENRLSSTDAESDEETRTPRKTSVSVDVPDITDPILDDIETFATYLQSRKCVLLYGPSGTGKRRGVREFAQNWLSETASSVDIPDRIFETSLNDGDPVCTSAGDSGTLSPYMRFIDLANADSLQAGQADSGPESPRYLSVFLDFGDLDSVSPFGNLWPLLDPESRGSEYRIEVGPSGHPLWIPDSFYVVGIVDTDCTAISDLPQRVLNRFTILNTDVNYQRLRSQYGYESRNSLEAAARTPDSEFEAQSILAFEHLNDRISATEALGWEHTLGEYYLLPPEWTEADAYSNVDLRIAWAQDILPRIQRSAKSSNCDLNADILPDDTVQIPKNGFVATDETVTSLVSTLSDAYFNG